MRNVTLASLVSVLCVFVGACGAPPETVDETCPWSADDVWAARDAFESATGLAARGYSVACVPMDAVLPGALGATEHEKRLVTLRAFRTIGSSSLFHELLHVALRAETGDSDHDHHDPRWGMIRSLKVEFAGCVAGQDMWVDLDCREGSR